MGHAITAIILKGSFDTNKAREFDLFAIPLGFELSLFHIDHYYSACWQHKLQTKGQLELSNINSPVFPAEIAICDIVKRISSSEIPEYAIIMTDYFGGVGYQYANVFKNNTNADKKVKTINQALRHLGVPANDSQDEFDTVGLNKIREQPNFLEKYIDIAEEYGV